MSSHNRVQRLSMLIDAAAAVVGEVELDQVLRRLVSEARRATGAKYAALGVLGSHGVLTDFIHEGLEPDVAGAIGAPPLGRGVLGTVVREGKTIVVDDISTHPDYYGFPEGHPAMTSFLGVPVRAGRSTFGNLYLTEKEGGFDDSDVAVIEALALIAGSAVNTARLRDRLAAMEIVEDRDRIARDLHDSIIQDLFAIGLSLQGLSERTSDETTTNLLDDAVDRLDSAVGTLRRYIYELKTSDDLRRSFPDQVEDLVAHLSGPYSAAVAVQVDARGESLETRTAEEALKLVTEALSNALRHSAASEIRVESKIAGGELTLTVADDGQGFDVETVERGMGLLNMAERARRLGGSVDVSSSPAGTTVTIRIPTG